MSSKAEKTRQFIIEQTAPLFNTKGYNGTSLTDITEATGLTKGGIYGNFENKDEVAHAAYQHSAAMLSKKVDAAMAGLATATEKLEAFTGFYRSNWQNMKSRGGCPLLNAAIEADDNLPFMKKSVQKSFSKWAVLLTTIISTGSDTGEFKPGIDASEYAYTFIMLLEGGIMLSKLNDQPRYLNMALDRIMLMVKQELSS